MPEAHKMNDADKGGGGALSQNQFNQLLELLRPGYILSRCMLDEYREKFPERVSKVEEELDAEDAASNEPPHGDGIDTGADERTREFIADRPHTTQASVAAAQGIPVAGDQSVYGNAAIDTAAAQHADLLAMQAEAEAAAREQQAERQEQAEREREAQEAERHRPEVVE